VLVGERMKTVEDEEEEEEEEKEEASTATSNPHGASHENMDVVFPTLGVAFLFGTKQLA